MRERKKERNKQTNKQTFKQTKNLSIESCPGPSTSYLDPDSYKFLLKGFKDLACTGWADH